MESSTIKLLYANSGGRCALCKVVVILSREDGTEYHTSEIAHIRGKRPKALRHDSTITDDEIDDISNLFVLCPTCHTMVDKNQTDYPVERLVQLKHNHEDWVRNQLDRETSDGFQVDIQDCIHIEENDIFVHHIDLKMSNNTTTTMRIDDISLFDDMGRKLEFVSRGQASATPRTKFELRGGEEIPWDCFFKFISEEEMETRELAIVIRRRGKQDFRKTITSMLVSKGKFPSGVYFTTIDML